MAIYTVATGMVGVHAKTLVANTLDAVNFTDDPNTVEIVSDGAAAIYVSVDGVNATVAGANTYVLPAVACSRTIPHPGNPRAVKLISAGTPVYSVMAV
jgi:hypothetical protein